MTNLLCLHCGRAIERFPILTAASLCERCYDQAAMEQADRASIDRIVDSQAVWFLAAWAIICISFAVFLWFNVP